jgi:cyclohexanecarboxyl-CoA dehydrogenase
MIFTEDQEALRNAARRFSRERLLPAYQQRERDGCIEMGLLAEMGQLGMLGVDVPVEYGGMGADSLTTGLIVEELAYGDFNIAAVVLVMSLCGAIIQRNASPELAAHWLARIPKGEAILALSITEPKCGSDAGALSLRARRDGDVYVLNGEKTSTTYCDTADAFIVFARTGSPEDGPHGVSAFLVPSSIPGITTTLFDDLGSRCSGRGSVFFDEVRVPVDHRLGDENKGFSQVMAGFDFSRALIALQCLGAAQASLDEAWAYAKEREAFGGPIARFQGVSFPLVEGETQIAAARQLSYHALALRDAGRPHTSEAAMVKWMAPKTSFDVIHQCALTLGHYGWSMDAPHQQRMRDVMGLEIGDGTAGIMKMVIARARAGRAATEERGATAE